MCDTASKNHYGNQSSRAPHQNSNLNLFHKLSFTSTNTKLSRLYLHQNVSLSFVFGTFQISNRVCQLFITLTLAWDYKTVEFLSRFLFYICLRCVLFIVHAYFIAHRICNVAGSVLLLRFLSVLMSQFKDPCYCIKMLMESLVKKCFIK